MKAEFVTPEAFEAFIKKFRDTGFGAIDGKY